MPPNTIASATCDADELSGWAACEKPVVAAANDDDDDDDDDAAAARGLAAKAVW